MDKIDELIEKAYKNGKTIELTDILGFELTDDEYSTLINLLQSKGISIKEEVYEEDDDGLDQAVLSDDFKLYLKDIGNQPLLTAEEEKNLFREYQETRSVKVRKKLIESNLRLVISVAKKYRSKLDNNINDLLDIVQEGNVGLIKAIEKFDVSFGNKFSTYAVWWIRSSIERALVDKGKTIRVPFPVMHAYNKIQKQKRDAELKGEVVASDYEIARSLGINEERAAQIIEAGKRLVVSINAKISEDDRSERIDSIPTPGPLLEETVIDKIDFENLENIIRSKLTPREFFVMCSKLGIVNEVNDSLGGKTLEEIGQMMGVTRERIRQILAKSFRKIKKECKNYYNIVEEEEHKIHIRW